MKKQNKKIITKNYQSPISSPEQNFSDLLPKIFEEYYVELVSVKLGQKIPTKTNSKRKTSKEQYFSNVLLLSFNRHQSDLVSESAKRAWVIRKQKASVSADTSLPTIQF